MTLQLSNLCVGYHPQEPLLSRLDLTLYPGQVTAIIGPNGSGKSTLMKTLAGLLPPLSGQIDLDGRPLCTYPRSQFVRRLAYLPQESTLAVRLTVESLVQMGRYPYQGLFLAKDSELDQVVSQALRQVGMWELRKRHVDELSGGQRQRMWLAMALAQQAHWLLLDEPARALDLHYEMAVLDLVSSLKVHGKRSVLMVLHDLNLAARYGDSILVLEANGRWHYGTVHEVMNQAMLSSVFALDAQSSEEIDGKPQFRFVASQKRFF